MFPFFYHIEITILQLLVWEDRIAKCFSRICLNFLCFVAHFDRVYEPARKWCRYYGGRGNVRGAWNASCQTLKFSRGYRRSVRTPSNWQHSSGCRDERQHCLQKLPNVSLVVVVIFCCVVAAWLEVTENNKRPDRTSSREEPGQKNGCLIDGQKTATRRNRYSRWHSLLAAGFYF